MALCLFHWHFLKNRGRALWKLISSFIACDKLLVYCWNWTQIHAGNTTRLLYVLIHLIISHNSAFFIGFILNKSSLPLSSLPTWGPFFTSCYPTFIHGFRDRNKGVHSLEIWLSLSTQLLFKVRIVRAKWRSKFWKIVIQKNAGQVGFVLRTSRSDAKKLAC